MSTSQTSQSVILVPRSMQEGMEEQYSIRSDQTTVGRHPSNDIILAFDSISRFHARIDARGEFFILQDLNSSNGCFVNGEKVTQIALHHGDIVCFGNVEFEFINEERSASVTTHSSFVGRDIVDIRDDANDVRPTTQSYIQVEKVAGRAKSDVISSTIGEREDADRKTLVKLNQRVSALYHLSELLRELDPDNETDILERVLDVIFQAVAPDRGVVMTRYHADAQHLDVVAVKYSDEPIVPQKVKVSRTILDQVLNQRISILSKDAQSDERFNASESIIAAKVRSAICTPMIVGKDVLGVIFLDTMKTERPFTQDDLEFATIVANETGIALSNMRMKKDAIHRQRLAAVGETVAGISHNVKNILLLSQGGAELLTRALEKEDMEGARDAWNVVSRGIDKIGKLVRDMLEFGSNKKPELENTDVNDLICNIAEEIEEELINKGITLELDLDDNLESRLLDQTGLQRTLTNLLVNGMEAINHKEGEIIVTTGQRPDKSLFITIRDNGAGIPPDQAEKIFFPFFTTKGSSGTGLGLPMCKKCIEDMGGTIEVESEEHIGTTFIIEIPVLHEETIDN